jgi:hypothetical protein
VTHLCAAGPYGHGMRGEGGQATVEWAGLVLLAVVVLAALGAVSARAPASDRGLGEVVTERFTCAARGACGGALAPRAVGVPPARAVPGAGARGITRARAIDALRRLRSVGTKLVRRAWIVCIGYRRFRYELEHPRAPNEVMPLDEAIDIANGCLNPYAFLAEEE